MTDDEHASAHSAAPPTRVTSRHPHPGLAAFLARARRIGQRRRLSAGGVEFAAHLAAIVLGATLLATATGRGDLAAAFAGLGGLVASVLVVQRTGRALHADYGRRRRRDATGVSPAVFTARTVARSQRPLYPTQGREPSGDPDVDRDGPFRREILAAAELDARLVAGGHLGSNALAARYVDATAARLRGIDPRRAVMRAPLRSSALVLGAVVAIGVVAVQNPAVARGASLLANAEDGRPVPPPQPVWSQLDMTLVYPAHTGRPARTVHNPSGTMRVPAGTRFELDLRATVAAPAARVVMTYDGESVGSTPKPEIVELEPGDERRFSGHFVVRAAGHWNVILQATGGGWLGNRRLFAGREPERRSPPLAIELEPDDAPEVDLRPLPAHRREVTETDAVDIRFSARDDFGLGRAELVYEQADGTQHRVPAGRAPEGRRRWRHRFTWDLSAIPVDARGEITYWIEVRDNDPGLGLEVLEDPPGKVGRSARQQLVVNDEEAEHAQNIESLRAIRDAAVDLLAERLTSTAYDPDAHPPAIGMGLARNTFARNEKLLAMMASTIDALAMDTMARERDVETLTAVHGRMHELHEKGRKIVTRIPPGTELDRPDTVKPVLAALRKHNSKATTNLEDEIIRLDDLVDAQIVERLEQLLSRVEAAQRKLVELLEQLKAGDESVRPQIEQLRQRIREDLRKVSEARSQLQKELGSEFMNLDAFRAMEKRMQRMDLEARLQRGDIDGALESAREGLDELGQLRDGLQKKLGEDGEDARLSPEERSRMQLLRELSRLLDEQKSVVTSARRHEQAWRKEVGDQAAKDAKTAGADAQKLREAVEKVNDARLGREGRRGWEDAREALEALESAAERKDPKQLELYDAARKAAEALGRATDGADGDEKEGKALEALRKRTGQLAERLRGELPAESEVFDEARQRDIDELGKNQGGVRGRTDELGAKDIAQELPDPGKRALEQAQRAMRGTESSLNPGTPRPDRAAGSAKRAADAIQRAIDSLRQNQSPPPPSASNGDASTEAERDRTLRDELVEAMKERAPEGFDEQVEDYYEELLR